MNNNKIINNDLINKHIYKSVNGKNNQIINLGILKKIQIVIQNPKTSFK